MTDEQFKALLEEVRMIGTALSAILAVLHARNPAAIDWIAVSEVFNKSRPRRMKPGDVAVVHTDPPKAETPKPKPRRVRKADGAEGRVG